MLKLKELMADANCAEVGAEKMSISVCSDETYSGKASRAYNRPTRSYACERKKIKLMTVSEDNQGRENELPSWQRREVAVVLSVRDRP